ncbi:MAG: cadherin-like domain-containing protein, partial [Gammaproteobacteria bacterium]|nr:cadherin-like domain-containing protein [Gammaproteobacteria bacterium]
LADLSNHGTSDVVSAAAVRNTTNWIVKVLIGSGNATFAAGPTLYNETSNATIGGEAVADVNGDGLPDVVASLTDSNTVRVWLNTSAPEVAPTASNVKVSTLTGTPVNGVLNGAQSQGGFLTYILVTSPSHGSVQLTNAASGAFTYSPTAPYFGVDTFMYKVNDGYLDSNVATATITVHSIPVAANNSIATTAGVPVNGLLTGSDPGGNPLTFSITKNGTKGSATITDAATGAFTYTPASGQTGQDTFTFSVSNGFANAGAIETLFIGAAAAGGGHGGGGALDLMSIAALLALLGARSLSATRRGLARAVAVMPARA